MKPPPVLDQPVDKTYSIANLHFNDMTARYGPIVNLPHFYQTHFGADSTVDYSQSV